jgi:diadenosine tetraphosphate (Ap4A) HIT family hydrolase
MPNATILKFNYPHSLLHEYQDWVVLLRPEQITAGSMVLACKLDVTRMSDVPATAFAELSKVTGDLESTLQGLFAYDKINYLLLMMVDKHVHFHVIPRYSAPRNFNNVVFKDDAWPKPPDLSLTTTITSTQYQELLVQVKNKWPA